MRVKGAEKGQNLIIFWGALVFPREFAIPQQGKSKSIFEIEGQKVANCGCVPRWSLGLLWGSLGSAGGLPL